MKTLTYFSKFKYLVLLTMTALAFTACGKKGGGNPNGNGYPVYPNCPGCNLGGGQAYLLNTVKFSYTGLEGSVSFLAQNNGSANLMDPKAAIAYSGPVVIAGQIVLAQGNSFCGALPGVYNVNPIQPADYQVGVVGNIRLLAQGPSRIEFVSTSATSQVYNTSGTGLYRDSNDNRFGMNVQLTVNGQPCGPISTY